jgi:ElaB/YqjD/DUF883 family membrane-anchored ribosome-binding protein
MTDAFSAATPDDIDDEPSPTTRLEREADALLERGESRSFEPTTSLRRAVREDIGQGRDWARARADAARDAIVDQPLSSTLYALGAGVLIGLLLRR